MKRTYSQPPRVAADTLLRSVANRTGATLSEILISLMVMSIGVVSLATLFPISVLRSIQASQLTNATIHRLNVEQLIGKYPRLVHDPDYDWNLRTHEDENPGGMQGENGFDNPINDGANGDGKDEGRFIVDPLGWYLSSLPGEFGNNNDVTIDNTGATILRRYNGGYSTATSARGDAYLPDSWQLYAKGNVTGTPTTTQITVPTSVDLTTFQNSLSSNVAGRVVLFSQDGRQSITRALVSTDINPTNSQINWTGAIPTASPYYVDTDSNGTLDTLVLSRFRLETYDPRYSWLLTVRKTPTLTGDPGHGQADVDIVVFHKRSFSAASEQIYIVQSWIGNQCTLDLTSTNALSPPRKPFLKKGGFLFDAQNARWYRIIQIVDDPVRPVITLDQPVFAGINNGTIVQPRRVMAMPGIVEVYSIVPDSYDVNSPP
jgi:hypothetical protein